MKIIKFAARNIFRNLQRTTVTVLAMAFACCIMIVYSSLMKGMVLGSERQAVIINKGDIQIHHPNYRENTDLYDTINDASNLLNNIRAQGFYSSSRYYAYGLAASDESSSGVLLVGLDLKNEPQVTELHLHLSQGNWLVPSDPFGVIIGKKLARLLNISIGDEFVYIGQTSDGYMANELFKVRGILKSVSAEIDASSVFMSDQSLIEILSLAENPHEITIMRADRNSNLDKATKLIAALAPNQETLNWRELMPVIAQFLETADIQTFIMLVFTYIAVASIILNAMLMSVFERIHEFGIMKAIGVSPFQAVLLIYCETFLQTLIAVIIGLAFGVWLSLYLQTNGIDMSSFANDISFAGIAFDPIWYAHVTLDCLLNPILFLFLIAFLAVIYPAQKIARIKAIDAIHYQ